MDERHAKDEKLNTVWPVRAKTYGDHRKMNLACVTAITEFIQVLST